jgi:hypothetical protein
LRSVESLAVIGKAVLKGFAGRARAHNNMQYQVLNNWLPFLDTYRTMWLALQPDFKRVLAGVLAMELAA